MKREEFEQLCENIDKQVAKGCCTSIVSLANTVREVTCDQLCRFPYELGGAQLQELCEGHCPLDML